MDSFNTAFTDMMSLQKAKAEFCTIKMEKGELDTYIAKFERLACLAGYDLQDQMVLDRFGSGLNSGLYIAIINNEELLRHGRDVHPTWVKSSIETLSNTRIWGSVVQGQSPKRTLTVTNEKWLTA